MMEYKFDFSVPPELDGQQMREQWSLHTHTHTNTLQEQDKAWRTISQT